MKKTSFVLVVVLILSLLNLGCDASKKAAKMQEKTLPEVVVTPDDSSSTSGSEAIPEEFQAPKVYQPTFKKENDLLHTKLEVKFDWAKQHILGKATLTLKPYFYPTNTLALDAKNMEIKSVVLEGTNTSLKFDYVNNKLKIELGKTYTRTDKYTIVIEYIGKPNEAPIGGSAAITEDKGLYFINPLGEDKNKPMQIWTQGETESNSHWFPTIDKPNEKTTSEIYMTVEDKYKTLSNGLLESAKKNTDGTRTDHWVMDKQHAVYLLMMAVGDFTVIKEKWNGMDLMYYVEPKYEASAKTIFKNTPELLTFYSNILGLKYPWQKYAQVVVRDYVSGAMENTTAVIFGEFMNGTNRELIDNEQNELVVAHEMFHHWFGDYVTAESWSNLTVNESFANYSEYLWTQHKYGDDAADRHLLTQFDGYLNQAKSKTHPLVDFYYEDKENMFDGHSYNKGGCILNMLRNYVGDEAFFASLNKYLTDNAYGSGEAHQLRLAFEAVTGEDMNRFWNQWYYAAGHPKIDFQSEYDAVSKKVNITISQTQIGKDVPSVFDFPVKIAVYTKDGAAPTIYKERIKERSMSFSYDVVTEPELVDFDVDKVLLCELNETKTDKQLAFQYNNAPKYLNRLEAIEKMKKDKTSTTAQLIFTKALNDKFWSLRESAIDGLELKAGDENITTLKRLAVQDPHSKVRAAAIDKLASLKDATMIGLFKDVLQKEQAYPTIGKAIYAINEVDPKEGKATIAKFENDKNASIIGAIGEIYAKNPEASQINFYENHLSEVDGMQAIEFVSNYGKLVGALDKPAVMSKLGIIKNVAITAPSPWVRFGAAKAINEIRGNYKKVADTTYGDITKILEEIKSAEKNDQLKTMYEQVLK
jgi:aminopeptidase N